MSQPPRKRVVFVGIDGATWDIIEPMVAAGKLPNLAAMMAGGSYGPLESTKPPNSSLAWTSFQTGVHPGKHGVYFFREQRPGSYERPVVSLRSVQAPTVWRTASEAGKKVSVAYLPMTFPPEELSGGMVGGLLTPDRRADFVKPDGLRPALEQAVGFELPSDNEPELLYHSSDERTALASLIRTTEQVEQVGMAMLDLHDPDLFALVFRGVDLASHQAWCFQDPEWAARNPEAARGREGLLADMYQRLDAALGRFRDKALAMDGEVSFGCCSDHGFGPISYRFYVNAWLAREGYLVLKKGAAAGGGRLRLWLERKWTGLLRRTGISRRRLEKGAAPLRSGDQTIRDMIDWSRTRAYSSFSGGEDIVLVNLKGRQPEGIVEAGAEYEALRDEILAKLLQVRAEDGTRIVAKAFRREDLWQGPQLHLAPDIQFITHETSVNAAPSPVHPRVVEPAVEGRPAMHRMQGVYLWEGPGVFRRGHRQGGYQIADMGAMMLHLLGLPLGEHLDGRVMEEVLEPAYREANPARACAGAELKPRTFGADAGQDDAKLVETMRALGYME
ncbi:MAG: alkaline phosphatase family protein [Planctomycetes bacterium]|nr:alkaline phosphatase family protein [Planctomycetota bacterium]